MGLSEKLTEIKLEIDALIDFANVITSAGDIRLGDAVRTLCAGYGSGGNYLTDSWTIQNREISHEIASRPFIPKNSDEIIIFNTRGVNKPDAGSIAPYAFMVLLLNGKVDQLRQQALWIAGPARTAPWESVNLISMRDTRSGSEGSYVYTFNIDDDGYFITSASTWGYIGVGNIMERYEIPIL